MAKRTLLRIIQISVFLVTGSMLGLTDAMADMHLQVPYDMDVGASYVFLCSSLGVKVLFSWQWEDVNSTMLLRPNSSSCVETPTDAALYICTSTLPFIARIMYTNKTIKCSVKESNGFQQFEVRTIHLKAEGGWSEWSVTQGCDDRSDHTCGTVVIVAAKTRQCNNPSPLGNGLQCVGRGHQEYFQECVKPPCPVDGYWSEWAMLRTLCYKTCGPQLELVSRTRYCNNPAPKNGGNDCAGNITLETYYHNCTRPPCPGGSHVEALVAEVERYPLQDVFLALGLAVYILVVLGIAVVMIIRQRRLKALEFRVNSDPTIATEIVGPQIEVYDVEDPQSKFKDPQSKMNAPPSKIKEPPSEVEEHQSKIKEPPSNIKEPQSKIKEPQSKVKEPQSKIVAPQSKIKEPQSKIVAPQSKIVAPQNKITEPQSNSKEPQSKIKEPQSKIVAPQSKIVAPQSKIEEPQSKIVAPQSKIKEPQSKIVAPQSKIEEPQSNIKKPQSKNVAAQSKIKDPKNID